MTFPSRLTMLSGFAATIVAGLLLVPADIAIAGSVRDHRSGKEHTGPHSTEGGVSKNGQVTKATKNPGVNLHGIDKGKSNTYTVRDHR
jgi:hypothetical protein